MCRMSVILCGSIFAWSCRFPPRRRFSFDLVLFLLTFDCFSWTFFSPLTFPLTAFDFLTVFLTGFLVTGFLFSLTGFNAEFILLLHSTRKEWIILEGSLVFIMVDSTFGMLLCFFWTPYV